MSRDRIFLSRDKSVDLTGDLSCRATLFERLRHIFSAYDKFLACDVILVFRSIAGTGDLLSKHTLGIL